MKRKWTALMLAAVLCVTGPTGFSALGAQGEEEAMPADQSYLYGMDYIAFEGIGNGIDYKKGFELMHNLGVKSIRHWMHVDWFFDEEFNVRQGNVDTMKAILAEAAKYDFQLVGMNHHNINKYGPSHVNDKVSRSSGYYEEWIGNYERGWHELAKLFPEITIWEIDNETNNIDFMHNAEGAGAFSLQEMADISTDLFFYGSRGIHRANPEAVTVMGGFVTWSGEGFLKAVYENIKSGEFGEGSTDPDDYFQALAWHPYTTDFDAQSFVQDNQALYGLIRRHEGKDKKVYFTELGNWGNNQPEETAAAYVKAVYETVRESLPFVESVHYYRAFNNLVDNGNQGGLFRDPNPDRQDILAGVRAAPGSPRPAAYAYQQVAGGEGSLELLMSDLHIVTSREMVEKSIEQNMGKVSADENFDYELLMGNAEGALSPFPYFQNTDNTPTLKDAQGEASQTGRFISSFQVRGGRADSNIVVRITAKKDIRFCIAFEAKSDWASGYFQTVRIEPDGTRTQIDRTDIAAGSLSAPVVVGKPIEVRLEAGDTLLFYFGNDTTDWQTVYFTASFSAAAEGAAPEASPPGQGEPEAAPSPDTGFSAPLGAVGACSAASLVCAGAAGPAGGDRRRKGAAVSS